MTTLQNEFGALALDATSVAIKNRLPAALNGDGGLLTHVTNQIDIADRSGRIVGHVTVDNASLTTDIADRVGRILGHVQVDNFPASQTINGTVALDAGTLAALESITVVDGGGSLTVDGPLTDAQLRATSVPVTADTELTTSDLDTGAGTDTRAVVGVLLAANGGAQLMGTANPLPISDNGGSVTIDGQVSLDAGTLAALESITVVDGGASLTVDDGGASLTIDGTIALDAPTLAALETIGLDSATLAALEHISIDNFPAVYPINDNGGSITVDDGAGSITVDGSVTADTELTTADLDTGAGTDVRAVTGMVIAESGGGQLVGSAHPLPVSDGGGTLSVDDGAGSLTIDGTVTISNPTTNPETGLAKDATLTGGTQKSIQRGGAKGATTAADLTSTAEGTDHQALDVQIYHGGAAKDPTQIRALTSGDVVTVNNPTANPETGLAKDATLTGGTVKAINRGGAKGATAAADMTSTAEGTDHQALDVQIYHGGAAKDPTQTRALTAADVVTANQGTPAANANAWPVTDAAGSLTVDAPVATPVFVRLSDGAAAITTLSTDPSDKAAREVGRVRLWDGTDEATVIPRGTAPAAADKGAAVMVLPKRLPFYEVDTTEITLATTTGVKEMLTLWHPNTVVKDVLITEIWVLVGVGNTAGRHSYELQFMTAENGTPGGTALTPQPLNRGDAASGITPRQVVTGAPTVTGSVFGRQIISPGVTTSSINPSQGHLMPVFQAMQNDLTDAIYLRNGQSEGLRLTANIASALTGAPILQVRVKYAEFA